MPFGYGRFVTGFFVVSQRRRAPPCRLAVQRFMYITLFVTTEARTPMPFGSDAGSAGLRSVVTTEARTPMPFGWRFPSPISLSSSHNGGAHPHAVWQLR